MKTLLIIQMDGVHFLEETLRVLERFHSSMKDFELTMLVSHSALKDLASTPLVSGITANVSEALSKTYDLSFNLSMDEATWNIHGKINSSHKSGPSMKDGTLSVPDLWSTFLLTLKAQPPFLTFHLQDIYRNILGIKRKPAEDPKSPIIRELVLGSFNPSFFAKEECHNLINELKANYPGLTIKGPGEADLISDLSHTLYLGPASLDALRLCEAGASGLFFGRHFQGLSLMPNEGNHFLVTTNGAILKSGKILAIMASMFKHGMPLLNMEYSVYEIEHENLFGSYLKSLNHSDSNYPFYQSHVVLWNFLLNLFDVNLDITKCNLSQTDLIRENKKVLTKLIRLHDYAMSSIDIIYNEAKSQSSRAHILEGHLKNLREIDELMDKISSGHPMLGPFLDYYRIRRGQNDGTNLVAQIQHSYLTYNEEHHALTALDELFSVTLRKNEVSI